MVLGGGNSGLEEGLFLTQFTDKVTVVEYKRPAARQSGCSRTRCSTTRRWTCCSTARSKSFPPKDDGSGKLGAVVLENLQTGETEEHHPAGVFVFIGLDPNTGFLKGTVDLDERGSSRPTTRS